MYIDKDLITFEWQFRQTVVTGSRPKEGEGNMADEIVTGGKPSV